MNYFVFEMRFFSTLVEAYEKPVGFIVGCLCLSLIIIIGGHCYCCLGEGSHCRSTCLLDLHRRNDGVSMGSIMFKGDLDSEFVRFVTAIIVIDGDGGFVCWKIAQFT